MRVRMEIASRSESDLLGFKEIADWLKENGGPRWYWKTSDPWRMHVWCDADPGLLLKLSFGERYEITATSIVPRFGRARGRS